MRATGVQLQGMNIRERLPQAELRRRHPGERTEVVKLRVHLAEQKLPLIAEAQVRVLHLQRGIAGGKVQRDFLAVPDQLAMAHVQPVNGKSEELLNGSLPRASQNARARDVGRA